MTTMRMLLLPSALLAGLLAVVAPAVLVPVLVVPAMAQQAASGPAAPISALYAALGTIDRESSLPFAQRSLQLAPAVDRAFNLQTVLQSSVGFRYRSLPDSQKQQLAQVVRQFTIARYVSNFSGSNETFRVLPGTRPSAYGSDQIVQTELVSPSGATTRIDYVMRQFPQGWQAVDVLLDGRISQVAVQRSDFSSAVSNGNASSLIQNLQRKVRSFSET
jgi:phospholipid transport system substrate-binding protein